MNGFDQRETGCQGERRCGWIGFAQPNQRAPKEICRRGNPFTTLSSAARSLLQRDQPVAFNGVLIGEQIGVCRAGLLDDPNAAQTALFTKTEPPLPCR